MKTKRSVWSELGGNGSLKNPGLKGSLKNQKWCLEEPFFKVL